MASTAPRADAPHPACPGARGGVVRGSAVALAGQGCLIVGASGAGKSSLALALIGQGATLLGDDGIKLRPAAAGGPPILSPVGRTRGLIEVRGVGLLRAPVCGTAPLALAIDLDLSEPRRLPPFRTALFCGVAVPLIWGSDRPHLAEAVRLWLEHGRAF